MNDTWNRPGFSFWPQSKAGRSSVALAALFLLVLGLNLWTAQGDGSAFFAFATFIAALGALVSLILAVVAIVRHHDRSVLGALPLVIGVLVFVFFAVEILIGHD